MEVSPKELRKMLNAAWMAGRWCWRVGWWMDPKNRRYRDVSRILEAKKKEGKKDG